MRAVVNKGCQNWCGGLRSDRVVSNMSLTRNDKCADIVSYTSAGNMCSILSVRITIFDAFSREEQRAKSRKFPEQSPMILAWLMVIELPNYYRSR
jgi:hypothetical protein